MHFEIVWTSLFRLLLLSFGLVQMITVQKKRVREVAGKGN